MSLSLLFTAAELWASSAPGGEAHVPSATQLLLPAINFLIFLYLIKRFALPLIRGHLRARRDEMVAALAEAAQRKQSAEALVRDYRDRVARLEEEIRKLRGELAAEGEREKAKLLDEAREIAARIRSDADFLAEQEVKLARQELREEIARLAQKAARELLRGSLQPADQRRLMEEFLSGVGQK